MPRRKQGHSKESATGGYLKKRTGIVLYQNESFKHLPTSNDLVFKIKKTVSSVIPLPTSNEKIAREHIEVSKSLSDINMVSQKEVNNNNLVKREEGEQICNSNETKNSDEQQRNRKEFSENNNYECGRSENMTALNVPVNNSVFVISTTRENEKNSLSQNVYLIQNSVIKSNTNQLPITNNRLTSEMAASPNSDKNRDSVENTSDETERQNGEMSGVIPTVTPIEGLINKTESQQMNYRISISENRSNHTKDAVNPVVEQNCQLPSSVYGTPASSVEKVLMGLQVLEKDVNIQASGKVSFLQEILEKKSVKTLSSKSVESPQENNVQLKKSAPNDTLVTNVKQLNYITETKDKNRTELASQSKLKLQIPDGLNNDDSESSVISTESFKTSKFPKITSPQILEQHISKIISENAAIVETLDPMWSRRFNKQTSQLNAINCEDFKKASGKVSRMNEDKYLGANSSDDSNKSKLQSALLGGHDGELLNANQNVSFSTNIPQPKEKHLSQFNNLLTNLPSASMYSKMISSVSEEELTGNAVKSLLSLKQGKYTKHKKTFFDKDLYSQHPQNPEGSIIKDLLLKSKSQEELRMELETESKPLIFSPTFCNKDLNNQTEKSLSLFKCLQCSAEFSSKYNLDAHVAFCKAESPLNSLRESTEKFRFKDLSAQSKPLSSSLDFRYKTKEHAWENSKSECSSENAKDRIGQILKQQLLMPRSPPIKRRKVSDTLFGSTDSLHDGMNNYHSNTFSNLEPHRARSQSVHLFGGEVRVMDGSETKKIHVKTTLSGAFSMFNKASNSSNNMKKLKSDSEKDANNFAGAIVTIANANLNSGATVHFPSQPSVVAVSSNISDTIPKFLKTETSRNFDFSRHFQSDISSNKKDHTDTKLSYPCDFLPGPDSAFTLSKYSSSSFKANEFISSSNADEPSSTLRATLSIGRNPFYSPILPAQHKTSDLPLTTNLQDKPSSSHPIVPTVLFTPSSPTMPSTENENVFLPVTSTSEPTKKFLAPTRPNSLPLKKKPFTMVSSTLVSPETPRPKKSCVQLYLNGHAYTYLGLKCSTRSTYCSIYRPQPMFVPQDTNPKLSMYSNWQVMPAKEELSGHTPGQMISLYCSKQKEEFKPITINSKVGEPLIFTHSSYWTYRSQDHPEKRKASSSYSDSSIELKDLQSSSEKAQESIQNENSRSESVISSFGAKQDRVVNSTDDSSLHVDTENTCSEGDPNYSNDEDDDEDDDCDGTESFTDPSQPQAPKRVKIFEGGFKSNEDYTYVRGRGRGKYVCEECGIRCKKPSMLKKHIRTHTDLRPYKCRHCSFAFKTKGNLTKHMKSKAHHKKCTELGIFPVPTTTDDSQVDEEALAKQIEKKKQHFSDGEDADDDEDEDSDESDDDCESDESSMISSQQTSRMMTNGHLGKSDSQDRLNTDSFDGMPKVSESTSQKEQEAVRSLLNLSALGEPSQWSISTGNLTDVTSSGETEDGSLAMRSDHSMLSPSPFASHIMSRSKNLSDQWLSTETLGHRPRSYSADIPQSSGKDSLAKYKYLRTVNAENSLQSPVDELNEFGGRETFARRYSISVAREARKPHVLHPPEWIRASGNPLRWLDGESVDQPMDLSITRDLGKCKPVYATGLPSPLMNMVTPEENASEANLSSSLDAFGEPYQLKSLPVLSPQVIVDYEASCDNISTEASLFPLTDEQAAFASGTQRSMYYVQDIPTTDVSERKDTEAVEDPPSPDITDYAVCSPVSPPTLEDSSYYYSQDNATQANANAEEASPSSRFRAEFIVPSSSSSGMEEGKCICRICNKMFAKSSHLRLHVNIHYFERPFRCDNCAVSFRTKGHLQKHKRSVSHYNKVNMNLTFGTPTVDNPRPFKCGDCKIAFRIHGHLAKHLRSKMHIMKLECLGKLPFGMYAEMERSGISLNEIDTTDCNNSLESLQVMAQKLYQRDPRRMRWQGPEQISDTGCVIPAAPATTTTMMDSMLPISESLPASFETVCAPISVPSSTIASSVQSNNGEGKSGLPESDSLCVASGFSDSDNSALRYVAPATTSSQEPVQMPAESDSTVSLHRSCTCHLCGRLFKSAKFLQVHLYCDHPTWNPSSASEPASSSNPPAVISQELVCDLCGRQFPNQATLQQHLLTHAQPRPFVCELCDAGFTSSSSLLAHKATHQSHTSENKTVQLK